MRTLTRRGAAGDPLPARIEWAPLKFRERTALVESLRGARTLYNTYWIRFERGESTFARAVENSRVLFHAAAEAGVERVVHISVTSAAEDSPFPYFRGKAAVERALAASGVPFYRVRPVSVSDTAALCVAAADDAGGQTLDAAGPDTFTFDELVRAVATAVGARWRIVHAGRGVALALSRLVGLAMRDLLLTREELEGLMAGLLVSGEPPQGRERLTEWLAREGDRLGRRYVSELARNFPPYAPL